MIQVAWQPWTSYLDTLPRQRPVGSGAREYFQEFEVICWLDCLWRCTAWVYHWDLPLPQPGMFLKQTKKQTHYFIFHYFVGRWFTLLRPVQTTWFCEDDFVVYDDRHAWFFCLQWHYKSCDFFFPCLYTWEKKMEEDNIVVFVMYSNNYC